MSSSISSDNNSSQCVLSQTQTYTVHSSQVDVTTISPVSYTFKTSIKTSTTIYYESSHLSSLSQVTYSTTPPIVDVSSTTTIIAISVTAVLMVSIILITLFLAIIVLRRYGQFKPGR